ncbi:hypothetical protein MC885_021749 [Smutsia gigantea]|nr:hypothetical protein MC885_021749 [Smutsia gigantea]
MNSCMEPFFMCLFSQVPMTAEVRLEPKQVVAMKCQMKRSHLSTAFLYKGYHKKAHPCEVCGLILRDILHLVEHQGTHDRQKLHRCGACGKQLHVRENFFHHQKQCIGEKHFRNHVDRASFVKNCKCNVSGKPFMFRVIGKDILASSEFPQPQATDTSEGSTSETECGGTECGVGPTLRRIPGVPRPMPGWSGREHRSLGPPELCELYNPGDEATSRPNERSG